MKFEMTPRRWLAVLAGLVLLALSHALATQWAHAPEAVDTRARPPAESDSGKIPLSDSAPSPDNAAAASRLFRFRMTCARVIANDALLEQLTKDPNSWVNNDEVAQRMDADSLEGWRVFLADWEQNRDTCKQLGDAATDGSIYDIALRAANAGNGDAATCYIMTRWPTPRDPTFKGPIISHIQTGTSPRFLLEYRTNARRLLDEGLRRGDWRMVTLLDMAINERHGQPIGGLRSFDPPNEEYVNLKLMLLGTVGEKAQEISGRVEFALQQVPAGQVAAANARAQAMFDAHFADKGPYEWGFGGCR